MKKIKVVVYIKKDAASTKALTNFIAKNIDEISRTVIIDLKPVTAKNVEEIKRLGIDRTPTLVYGGKKYISLERIVKILTPKRNTSAGGREGYGADASNPDELIHKYQDGVINTGDNDYEDDPRVTREDEIRRKMASFQKRRPQMSGMEGSDRYLKGGRKIVNKRSNKGRFDDDDDFRRATGVDDQEDTPQNKYLDETDGNLILEDYYNHEADLQGRKKNTKPIRWSS
jgi:hypothetical protein